MLYDPVSAEEPPAESEYDSVIHAIERMDVTEATDLILQRLGQELLERSQGRCIPAVAYRDAIGFLRQGQGDHA